MPKQWRNASNCCGWIGVKCEFLPKSPIKHVVRLELGKMKLEGSISSSLAHLDQLRYLNLSSNSLGGPLPQELFMLSRLQILDLSNNQFNGTVPKVINLPSIRIFILTGNQIEGHQPILGVSAKLTKFDIRGTISLVI